MGGLSLPGWGLSSPWAPLGRRRTAQAARSPARSIAVATFSLLSNMAFTTPSVKAATLAETRPAVAVLPAAAHAPTSTVEPMSPDGSDAGAAQSETRTAERAAGQKPFRASRR